MIQHKDDDYTAAGFAGCFLLCIFAAQKENKESKKNEKESQKSKKFGILKEEQKKGTKKEPKKEPNHEEEGRLGSKERR